jgi:hypothetical protein
MQENQRIDEAQTHKKIMERNQACSLFLYALNKDIISVIRSYMKRPFRYLKPIRIVEGCRDQMQAIKENAYEDLDEECIVLFVSNIKVRLYGSTAKQFRRELQYGCGKCEACLAPQPYRDADPKRHKDDA